METYHVDIGRDESRAWIATVRGVPGAHTHGRSLTLVRARVREALSLWVDDVDEVDLEFELHLPREARATIRRAFSARKAAAREQQASAAATDDAALVLVRDCGLSLRDAAELLGLSHQRLQQLLTRPNRRPA